MGAESSARHPRSRPAVGRILRVDRLRVRAIQVMSKRRPMLCPACRKGQPCPLPPKQQCDKSQAGAWNFSAAPEAIEMAEKTCDGPPCLCHKESK